MTPKEILLQNGDLRIWRWTAKSPYAIAVDSLGRVYVTDTYNNKIQKFDSDGTFITKWGDHGLAEGEFDVPRGIIVDNHGSLYVADYYNDRIQKFD